VVSIDLDGLKAMNDLHGHAHGDALLSRFAAELQTALPTGGSLFRLGGDEFVVLAPLDRGESPGDRPSQLSWLRLAVEATRKAGFGMASACAGEALFPRDSGVTAKLAAPERRAPVHREGTARKWTRLTVGNPAGAATPLRAAKM